MMSDPGSAGEPCWSRGYSLNHGLPVEAVLAVAAPLLGRQHEGVRRAGEDKLSDLKGFGDPESSPFSRAVEPLHSLDGVLHIPFLNSCLSS